MEGTTISDEVESSPRRRPASRRRSAVLSITALVIVATALLVYIHARPHRTADTPTEPGVNLGLLTGQCTDLALQSNKARLAWALQNVGPAPRSISEIRSRLAGITLTSTQLASGCSVQPVGRGNANISLAPGQSVFLVSSITGLHCPLPGALTVGVSLKASAKESASIAVVSLDLASYQRDMCSAASTS